MSYFIVPTEDAEQDMVRLRKSEPSAYTKKHRLIYEIVEDKVFVYVLAAYGHYDE